MKKAIVSNDQVRELVTGDRLALRVKYFEWLEGVRHRAIAAKQPAIELGAIRLMAEISGDLKNEPITTAVQVVISAEDAGLL